MRKDIMFKHKKAMLTINIAFLYHFFNPQQFASELP